MSEIRVVDDESAGRLEEGVVQQRLVAGFSSDALLHRMLAAADALTIASAAVIVGLWGTGADGAFLLVLSAPVWVVTAKLIGLYDRDHRTMRHLTVEELPWIIVWALSAVPRALPRFRRPAPGLEFGSRAGLLLPRRRACHLAEGDAAGASLDRRRGTTCRGRHAQARALPGHSRRGGSADPELHPAARSTRRAGGSGSRRCRVLRVERGIARGTPAGLS